MIINKEWVNENYHGESVFAIPEGVKYISEGAFMGCKSLVNVTIPEGVTSIGVGRLRSVKTLKILLFPRV